jgi:hypothetical protein
LDSSAARHAYRAGNFGDIFKQLLVHTIVELKVAKKAERVEITRSCDRNQHHPDIPMLTDLLCFFVFFNASSFLKREMKLMSRLPM